MVKKKSLGEKKRENAIRRKIKTKNLEFQRQNMLI